MTNLDAKAVATTLGVESRVLRRFLRSDVSSFTPVGTGNQYRFEEKDLSTLEEEFKAWKGGKSTRKPVTQKAIAKEHPALAAEVTPVESSSRRMTDLEVWAEDEWTTGRIDAALLRYQRDPAHRAMVAQKDREANERLLKLIHAAELSTKKA